MTSYMTNGYQGDSFSRGHRRTSSLPSVEQTYNQRYGTLPSRRQESHFNTTDAPASPRGLTTNRSGQFVSGDTLRRTLEKKIKNDHTPVTSQNFYKSSTLDREKKQYTPEIKSGISSDKRFLTNGNRESHVMTNTAPPKQSFQQGFRISDSDENIFSNWQKPFQNFNFAQTSPEIIKSNTFTKDYYGNENRQKFQEIPSTRIKTTHSRYNSGNYEDGYESTASNRYNHTGVSLRPTASNRYNHTGVSQRPEIKHNHAPSKSKSISKQRGYASDSEDSMSWLEQQRARLEEKRMSQLNLQAEQKLLEELRSSRLYLNQNSLPTNRNQPFSQKARKTDFNGNLFTIDVTTKRSRDNLTNIPTGSSNTLQVLPKSGGLKRCNTLPKSLHLEDYNYNPEPVNVRRTDRNLGNRNSGNLEEEIVRSYAIKQSGSH